MRAPHLGLHSTYLSVVSAVNRPSLSLYFFLSFVAILFHPLMRNTSDQDSVYLYPEKKDTFISTLLHLVFCGMGTE